MVSISLHILISYAIIYFTEIHGIKNRMTQYYKKAVVSTIFIYNQMGFIDTIEKSKIVIFNPLSHLALNL